MPGDARFHALLREIGELHDKKQEDYGVQTDPFANIRGSSDWGIKPWVGAMIRANDKIKRLQKYARTGELANEAARDSFMDLAVYALIALVLHDESDEVVRDHPYRPWAWDTLRNKQFEGEGERSRFPGHCGECNLLRSVHIVDYLTPEAEEFDSEPTV